MAGIACVAFTGCGPDRVGRPELPAPAAAKPVDIIPADLDLIIRIDLSRIRSSLGAATVDELRRRAELGARDEEGGKLFGDALSRANTVWIAVRPGLAPELTDNVIVLRGDFAAIEPHAPGLPWKLPSDLGGGWRLYERDQPKQRAAAARLYLRQDDLMVFVSTAEIDSVERRLEHGAGAGRLEPPAVGVISAAARIPPLIASLRKRAPSAARWLEPARVFHLTADLSATDVELEVEIEFELDEQASDAAEAADLLGQLLAGQSDLLKSIVDSIRVEAVGATLVVRATLPRELLLRLTALAD